MRWLTVWLLTVVCFAAMACGPTDRSMDNETRSEEGPLSPEKVAALEDALRSKPPLEAAQAQYRTAVSQIADAVAGLVSGLTWRLDTDSWRGCDGPYVWTRAKYAYLMVVFSGPIPDDKWPQAVQIVKDGVKQFGATNFGVMKDKPNDHDVYFSGHDGVDFKFSTQKAAVLTAQSDCRMSQADGPTPAPTRHP
ncbi:LppA family lipoprotein [Mycobacterium shimoidei]|uniref:Lipoprotein LppA n=1 Tax=Mycobacterium shimoidei TaxID=29313 RepID=A0A1E3TIA4_MYCSH|nr:LppA family lipoprotein [Mycobacterium shimoidei]MCV7257879.1 LppA family lipoprotein [Mycobacterium shimoidei]ODR14174.1 hypothetical protein BHQ16_07010 [Mycobacterium shimoidei]ORW83930.1 hypothetical protein AWC26_00460 [Mycobacterium shimoidei]SRX91882.1 Putative lipoprotein LppA [Mycobacterium shimoidei]